MPTKIQGITLDNAAANTRFIHKLAELSKTHGIDFDIDNQHSRCFAHILNLGVQDVLKLVEEDSDDEDENEGWCEDIENTDDGRDLSSKEISQVLGKVRSLCGKFYYSEQLTNNLKLYCATAGIESKEVVLNVRTRWNSTHDMLEVFLNLKKGIAIMFKEGRY